MCSDVNMCVLICCDYSSLYVQGRPIIHNDKRHPQKNTFLKKKYHKNVLYECRQLTLPLGELFLYLII